MNWEGCGRKRSWHDLGISRSVARGTEGRYEHLNGHSRLPCRNSNRQTPENKPEASMLGASCLVLGNWSSYRNISILDD
jgi:hypothetical protein